MNDTGIPKPVDTILVVDDEPVNRKVLNTILTRAGYNVEEAASGLECIDYCSEKVPRMILLDVMMPELNGLEACKLLRSMYSRDELPIIIVTTKSEDQDIAAGLEVGANDYVTKPVQRISLLARIENEFSVVASRRELEAQQRSIERALRIQNAMGDVLPDAIVVHNQNGLVLYSNEPLMVVCGGAVPGTIYEVSQTIFNGVLADIAKKDVETCLADSYRVLNEEYELKGVQAGNFQVTSQPITLDDGTGLRVWLWRDLTHLRELEQTAQLQVRIEAVSTFTSGVAHNFNNLMGSILGAAELLDRVVVDSDRGKRLVSVIKLAVEGGRLLTRKMSGIVQVSDRANGDSVVSVVGSLQRLIAKMSAMNDGQITFNLKEEGEYLVDLSEENFNSIFENIFQNAVDSIEGDGQITVAVQPSGEARVTVTVTDNGVGMDDRSVLRVCEPFYSTKNMDERNQVSCDGSGLGMWNVYNLVKIHGGDLEIRSKAGSGTEVEVIVPIRAAAEQGAELIE